MTTVHRFGIDVETQGKAALIRSLGRLKGTVMVADAGVYHEDRAYSVVRYTGEMTQEDFDKWSDRVKVGTAVIGTFNLL